MLTRIILALALLGLTGELMGQPIINAQPPAAISDEASLFYVPFNDHGEWGYSDTLGNIIMEPKFLEVSLFKKHSIPNGTILSAVARVKAGEIIINPEGQSILPKKTTVRHRHEYRTREGFRTLWVIQKKNGRTAIIEPGATAKPDFKYEQISEALFTGYNYGPLLLKNRKTKKFEWFNGTTNKIEPTNFRELIKMYPGTKTFQHRLYAVTLEGDTLQYKNREFVDATLIPGETYHPFTAENVTTTLYANSGLFDDASVDNNNYIISAKEQTRLRLLFGVDNIKQESRFRGRIVRDYGISKLYLARKGKLFGVLDQDGKELLPFTYDKIFFLENSTQAVLQRNGKYGRKLFFTIYPTIEPEYDQLSDFYRYRVSPRWSFVVFAGKLNGERVLVGENGTKYYKLD